MITDGDLDFDDNNLVSEARLPSRLFTTILSAIGWIALALSILSTFTVLPMSLILSLLESGGQTISSGESGGYWFLIAIYCFVPGVIGIFLLWLRRRVDGIVQKTFLRKVSFLIACQIIAMVLSAILSPYSPDLRDADFEKKLSPIDYENFRNLLKRDE